MMSVIVRRRSRLRCRNSASSLRRLAETSSSTPNGHSRGPPSTGSAESGLAAPGGESRLTTETRRSAAGGVRRSAWTLGSAWSVRVSGAGTLPVVPAAWMDLCRMPSCQTGGAKDGRSRCGEGTLRVAQRGFWRGRRGGAAQGWRGPREVDRAWRDAGPESPSGPPAEIGAKGCWLLTRSENRRQRCSGHDARR